MLFRKLSDPSNPASQLYTKYRGAGLLGLVLLILAMSGHLSLLIASLGVLGSFLLRNLPIVLRYAPQLQRFWQNLKQGQQNTYKNGYQAPVGSKMSVADAYQVLGLKPPVAKEEIILAHKKLMQKMHPDRGGSDYLASQINLAKDLLLKS